MIQPVTRYTRLYLAQAWVSFRAMSARSTPFDYLAHKFGFPFFTMLFFVFMGKNLGISNPIYMVIGNILLIPSSNCLSGISLTVGFEKLFGTLTYLLGSPAPRAPLFLGRALFHILDGFITVAVALPLALLIFRVEIGIPSFFLALLCVLIMTISTSGLGFIFGCVSLVSRDGWMITSTLALALYILVGVNFPVEQLPPFLKAISFGLPMTRGILAARMALDGAQWGTIDLLIYGEIVVGAIYLMTGYTLFRWIEKRSLVSGGLDNL
jgi:ABC-2 type transport system permease protein